MVMRPPTRGSMWTESRGGEEAESAEPEPPVVEDPDADARRADVHARARQAMDELS